MRKIKTGLFTIIIFGTMSCSKNDTARYKVKLINNTHFSLEKVKLGCSIDDVERVVEANSVSEKFILNYEEKKVFLGLVGAEPDLCIWISNFSDTITTYEGSSGNVFGLSVLREYELNLIKVDLDSTSNSGFSISIN